jgi:hypothetical protein
MPQGKRVLQKTRRSSIKHEDTTCVFKLEAKPETVEQKGFELEFSQPIIYEHFDSLVFSYLDPKQKEYTGKVTVRQDTLNLRRYSIRPVDKLLAGYEYSLKVPHHAFRDINGFWSDSTLVKVTLPTDETLSSLTAVLEGVDRKIIVDLLDEKRQSVLRSYITEKDCSLSFPYLKEGKYSIRVTDDGNRNSIVDTGSLLEHRQPESVLFVKVADSEYIQIPASAEVEQTFNIKELFESL